MLRPRYAGGSLCPIQRIWWEICVQRTHAPHGPLRRVASVARIASRGCQRWYCGFDDVRSNFNRSRCYSTVAEVANSGNGSHVSGLMRLCAYGACVDGASQGVFDQVGVVLAFAVVAAMIALSRVTVADLISDQLFMSGAGAMLEQTLQMALDLRKMVTYAHSRDLRHFTTAVHTAEANLAALRAQSSNAFLNGPADPDVLKLWSSRDLVLEWNVSAAATVRVPISMWDAAQNLVTAGSDVCAFEFETLEEVSECAVRLAKRVDVRSSGGVRASSGRRHKCRAECRAKSASRTDTL